MAAERGKQILMLSLAAILVVVVYRAWNQTSAAPSRSPGSSRGNATTSRSAPDATPDVHLDALAAERPKPGSGQRNLFRFKPKPPPAPPKVTTPTLETAPLVATGPPPPPPLPPITLKFIGTLDRAGKKIAVLSDSAGHVDYGAEGATIGGRYRVLKIGVESIEMSYLDGRGRQTIRLTGS
jgi:hypothetical protein